MQWVDIEGPLHDSWPPPSHRRIFGDLRSRHRPRMTATAWKSCRQQPVADAERLLREFMPRAFRRTVTDEDVKPFLARVKAKLDAKYSFEQAMRVGLKAVLVSPHFLFLRERPGKLDDFALASRLSYFLWSSMPDEELLTLAEQGKLSQPDTLRRQVERMLRRIPRRQPSRRTSSASGLACATSTPLHPTPPFIRNTTTSSRWRWSRKRTCSSTRC